MSCFFVRRRKKIGERGKKKKHHTRKKDTISHCEICTTCTKKKEKMNCLFYLVI